MARAADDERALDGAARYLGLHLFNPLYQLDVERLNEAIQQTHAWLPIASFLVIDRDGLVLTDGTSTNTLYGERAPGPLPGSDAPGPMVIRRGNATELRFRVAAGGVSAGWGIVTLSEPPWESLAAAARGGAHGRAVARPPRPRCSRSARWCWSRRSGSGLLTSLLLSRTLARPLTQMSRAAAQIAAGNLDHPLTLDSPDELGDLARALNRMAQDLRAHEEALRAERSDLAAKNAELERFNYTVSHDLKTPLVTIRGFAGLAGGDLAAGRHEAVRKDLGRIVAAADKMHRLLDDLLELSRIGRVVHPPEDVALGGLVREAIELLKSPLEAKGVVVEVSPDLPTVRADRRRLLEVLQNLLENAVKFTGTQAHPRVEFGDATRRRRARLLRARQRPGHRAALPRARLRPVREARPRRRRHGRRPRARAPHHRGARRAGVGGVGRASDAARPSASRSPGGARGALSPPTSRSRKSWLLRS